MTKSVFDFDSYKSYLEMHTGPRSQRRGLKTAMAEALRCKATFISQVLHGKSHLSLEQADQLNTFFGHSPEECEFFLLLVQRERAGTVSLRRFFDEKIQQMLAKRMVLVERLGTMDVLSAEHQARYYSSWHYAAIHIGLTVPALREPEAIARFFKLPLKKVRDVLAFLLSTGLATQDEVSARTMTGKSKVRLGNDSHNILRHHTNWRQQAIESLDREDLEDLHYSGVVSLSKKDAARIKDRLLDRLKEDLATIHASPEETLYSYCIDFFKLAR